MLRARCLGADWQFLTIPFNNTRYEQDSLVCNMQYNMLLINCDIFYLGRLRHSFNNEMKLEMWNSGKLHNMTFMILSISHLSDNWYGDNVDDGEVYDLHNRNDWDHNHDVVQLRFWQWWQRRWPRRWWQWCQNDNNDGKLWQWC